MVAGIISMMILLHGHPAAWWPSSCNLNASNLANGAFIAHAASMWNHKKSLPDFKKTLLKKAKNKKIDLRVINSYELQMPKYTRFMLFLT